MSQDKRTTKRYDVELAVEYTIGADRHTGVTRNASLGGLFLTTTARPAMGSRVQVKFAIPGHKEPVESDTVVRWVDAGGIGVQFDGLRARDVWALGKYFESL